MGRPGELVSKPFDSTLRGCHSFSYLFNPFPGSLFLNRHYLILDTRYLGLLARIC